MVEDTVKIKIPGEPTFGRSIVPPSVTILPLRARVHRVKNAFYGMFGLAFGTLFLVFALLVAPVGLGGSLSTQDMILFICIWPFALIAGIVLMGMAVTSIADGMRRKPVLALDPDGFRDVRSGVLMKCSAIRRATLLFTKSGIAGVDLHLREPTKAWQSPFRIGYLGFRYRPIPDHLIISVAFSDVRPHVLGFTILALVQRHGGEVVTKTSFVDIGVSTVSPTRI